MIEYEVRILNREGEAVIRDSEVHYSDIAAINWGRRLAKGMRYEIWRGSNKVFPVPTPILI
jgi:hypothetical protein